MERDPRALRTVDLLGVTWRSFFIQASWSYDRMQSLGFAFAFAPVLRRLYPDRSERSERLVRHMEYFNTQPYLASFILGAAARVEEERARGGTTGADPGEIKRTLMAPLGALGDSFFWGSFKPFAAVIAVIMLLAGTRWAPILFLGVYNLAHVGLRAHMVFAGYATRGDVVALLARYNFPGLARLFKVLTLVLAGAIAGTVSAWAPPFHPPVPVTGTVLTAATVALVLGMSHLLRVGGSPVKLMLGLAAVCLALAMGGLG